MGGAEQSLISLLQALDLSKYDVDLLLFEKKGDLLGRVPKEINVIETDVVTTALLLEFRYYFLDLLKTKHFMVAFSRLLILINSKLQQIFKRHILFSWNIAKRHIKPLEKEYDVAVGYLEGVADFYVAEKVKAKKKIGWIHIDFSSENRNFKNEKKLYYKFDSLCVISKRCKKKFLNYFPELENRIIIIENLSNSSQIQRMACIPLEDNYIFNCPFFVTVGRLEHQKGIDIAIEAAAILIQNYNLEFKWVVWGDGSLRKKLLKQIHERNLENYFLLPGKTQNPYKYIKNADLVIQTSRYEGKSIVLDEAKILCKPILVTEYPSVYDQIKNNETGRIVPLEPHAIAEGIMFMLENPQYREQIIKGCKKQINSGINTVKKVELLLDN